MAEICGTSLNAAIVEAGLRKCSLRTSDGEEHGREGRERESEERIANTNNQIVLKGLE